MKPCPRCSRMLVEGARCPACNPERTMLDELDALRLEHTKVRAILVMLRFGENIDANARPADVRVVELVDAWFAVERMTGRKDGLLNG